MPCGRAGKRIHTVKQIGKMPERNKEELLMKTKLTKLWSFLLSLVMLLSLLPTTVLAASPDASNVYVDGDKNFYNSTRL